MTQFRIVVAGHVNRYCTWPVRTLPLCLPHSTVRTASLETCQGLCNLEHKLIPRFLCFWTKLGLVLQPQMILGRRSLLETNSGNSEIIFQHQRWDRQWPLCLQPPTRFQVHPDFRGRRQQKRWEVQVWMTNCSMSSHWCGRMATTFS